MNPRAGPSCHGALQNLRSVNLMPVNLLSIFSTHFLSNGEESIMFKIKTLSEVFIILTSDFGGELAVVQRNTADPETLSPRNTAGGTGRPRSQSQRNVQNRSNVTNINKTIFVVMLGFRCIPSASKFLLMHRQCINSSVADTNCGHCRFSYVRLTGSLSLRRSI